jgi:hypothetical protein
MDRRFRWVRVVTAVLAAVIVGVISYNAGVSHGLAISPALANTPAGPYGWYRPWGFGFGFGPVFLLLLFWFLMLRLFFWGGFHRRRWHYGDEHGGPQAFEEWHRRAHERMDSQPSS